MASVDRPALTRFHLGPVSFSGAIFFEFAALIFSTSGFVITALENRASYLNLVSKVHFLPLLLVLLL